MSSFNETIPMNSFQAQTGVVGATAAQLVGVNDQPAHKGVIVKNLDDTTILYVGKIGVTVVTGYQLTQGQEIHLELENPADVYVIASGADNSYTWLAY